MNSENLKFLALPSQNVMDYESSTKSVPVRPYPYTILGLIPPYDKLYFNISVKGRHFKSDFLRIRLADPVTESSLQFFIV